MLSNLQENWVDFQTAGFQLQGTQDFPWDQYSKQLVQYREAENWFTGVALDDLSNKAGTEVNLYPLRINPIPSTIYKHAYTLFGEVEDDGRPLVRPKLITKPGDETQKKLAEEAEENLFRVWTESHGRALMMENGILSQIYGGCIFKASYIPWEKKNRTIPLTVERIHPKGFIGVPTAGDQYRLSEAWFVKPIGRSTARRYGYDQENKDYWFIEKWDAEEIKLWINDQEITKFADGEEVTVGGANPFGFVPAVYIPHLRIGTFLGVNVIDNLKGMVKEMNLRFGDYGDAVSDDSHIPFAMRNVQGSPKIVTVDGRKIIDLGSSVGISGNEPEPDLFEASKTRHASSSMKDLVNEIYAQYRRDSFTPAVADGEDEGSQRSGMTLAMRFWPLGSHVSTERYFWTPALNLFQTYLLKMMAMKKIGDPVITEEHTTMRMKQVWAPLLPRDREADVSEWVQRASANLGSIEHLLELTGDIEDIDEQREQILNWIREIKEIEAEAEAKANPMGSFGGRSPQGGGKASVASGAAGGSQ